MIIRSADRERIVNFENLSLLQMEIHDDSKDGEEPEKITYNIVAYEAGSTTCIVLAEYSTREQALKVLDEIQDNYSAMRLHTEDAAGHKAMKTQYDCCKCYQLPNDEKED